MNHRILTLVVAAVATLLSPVVAGAGEPEFGGFGASNIHNLDNSMPAKKFPPINLAFVGMLPEVEDGERSILCVTRTQNQGFDRRGVRVTMEVEILDVFGNLIANLGSKKARTDTAGFGVLDFSLPQTVPVDEDFIAVVTGRLKKKKITFTHTSCTVRNRKLCVEDEHTACLQHRRFKVQTIWRTFNDSGRGQVVSSSVDTALFKDPPGNEVRVEVREECKSNIHYAVSASGTATEFEWDLEVTDTQGGVARTYRRRIPFEVRSAFDCP